MSALGAELTKQREARLFSMSHLAGLTDYHHSHISRIESGVTASLECLVRLSSVLGTNAGSRWESFYRLLTAWLSDHDAPPIGRGETALALSTMMPYLPEDKQREIEATVTLLRDHAGLVFERMRLADDGCPNNEE